MKWHNPRTQTLSFEKSVPGAPSFTLDNFSYKDPKGVVTDYFLRLLRSTLSKVDFAP